MLIAERIPIAVLGAILMIETLHFTPEEAKPWHKVNEKTKEWYPERRITPVYAMASSIEHYFA